MYYGGKHKKSKCMQLNTIWHHELTLNSYEKCIFTEDDPF